ncbi:MAG: 4'-phosphopantetheinyl transferase superfamily protein [Mollicutes bacterium PWAP]|nr:4'-phosphopantetheinyl transferase superfamily protein [Mollicutes bacterium PWAP]
MIGIDITKISRFKNKNNSFIKRILSKEEIEKYEKSKNKEKFLASRWSLKESIFKAENVNFRFNKINIIKDEFGRYIYEGYLLSTSTEDDIYISVAIKKEK